MVSQYDEACRRFFKRLVEDKGISNEYVESRHEGGGIVEYGVVPPAYFNLPSDEYAIARGEEVMMECAFKSSRAHVFTRMPRSGVMRLEEILELDLRDVGNRSLFYCALNAVMRHYGLIEGSMHCRGDSPLKCARRLVEELKKSAPSARILLIGYQPAMAGELVKNYSKVYITDLNPRNIGKVVNATPVLSHSRNIELIGEADIVLATGSSLLNNTLWSLYEASVDKGKTFIVYGVSASGACKVLNIKRHCPLSQ